MEQKEFEEVHGRASASVDGSGSEWTDRKGFVGN